MKKINRSVLLFGYMFIAMIVWLSFARIAHGATHVSGTLEADAVWNKAGSPYILDGNLRVAGGKTLTIEPGVEVTSPTVPASGNRAIIVDGSSLFIKGKHNEPVKIGKIGGIYIYNSKAEVAHADVTDFGFTIENSRVNIATTTIAGTFKAVRVKDSALRIWDSRIQDNLNGIHVIPHDIFQVKVGMPANIGGIGNALDEESVMPSLAISNSIISNNEKMGLSNFAEYTVKAHDNWWGSAAGPSLAGSKITGKVEYNPWLLAEPVFVTKEPECCSSVLFIPGLQASRLYSGDNRLWEPNRNEDVRKLFLDASGSSTYPGIYAEGAIGKAYGLVDVYVNFLKFLENFAGDGFINEWKVFAYDWRKPINEVVAGREVRMSSSGTTTESLLDVVYELADKSKTGKVSIIAHSNGGLVLKHLIKTLSDQGRIDLVDTVISVAVPHIGTPKSVLALLHGYGQEIFKGLLLKEETAKELGRNMSSAYSLLPSREYFSRVIGPTIVFAGTSQSVDKEADTFEEQSSYISQKANSVLLIAGDVLHGLIDPFFWPSKISHWALVGWNVATSKSLNYGEKESCLKSLIGFSCDKVTTYFASTTTMGDGTVVSPSAAFNAGEVVYLDLSKLSEKEESSFSHSNILESSASHSVIKGVLTGKSASMNLPEGTSLGEPADFGEAGQLVVSTHSPVQLHIYDSKGRHTGPIAGPLETEEIYFAFEEGIPGSSFTKYGDENDPEMYINLPDHPAKSYSVVVAGTDVGVATLEVERIRGGETLERIVYNSFPVMPITVASTTVSSGALGPVAGLPIDIDGNGSVDTYIKAGMSPDPILNIEMIRTTARTLLGATEKAKELDKGLVKIQDLINKGKLYKSDHVVEQIQKKIGHRKLSSLSDEDKEYIIDSIELLIAGFD